MTLSNIPKNTYAVCYMDVLGYGDYVSKHWDNPQQMQKIENRFWKALEVIDHTWTQKTQANEEFIEQKRLIWKQTNIRLISDSLLIQTR